MSETEIVVSGFVKPYPQDVLGGEDGLTSFDIARSLGISVAKVNEKINTEAFKKLCKNNGYDLIAIAIKSGKRGRPGINWVLGSRASKACVSTMDNLKGNRYLDFLFDCEDVALKVLPTLLIELKALKEKVQIWEHREQRRLAKSRKGQILVPRYIEDMFGHIILSHMETSNKELASKLENLEAKQIHIAKVIEGLSKESKNLVLESGKERREKESAIVKLVKDDK